MIRKSMREASVGEKYSGIEFLQTPGKTPASGSPLGDTPGPQQFASSRDLEKTSDGLYEILQHWVEPLRGYIARFNQEKVAIPECSIPTAISTFKRGLLPYGDVYKELTKYQCKTMEDVMSRAWAHVKWEEDVASRAKAQLKQDHYTFHGFTPRRSGTAPNVPAAPGPKPQVRPLQSSVSAGLGPKPQVRPLQSLVPAGPGPKPQVRPLQSLVPAGSGSQPQSRPLQSLVPTGSGS
ncbi:hypothetical protein F2Q69_00005972 [Brassica cretica]|uniref:Uncharacterized protein n=1 Tax=Brassica cretica TaxID=69181 RepID=A0A8S9NWI1_BRACR|nr:hypothetical protein F2Q69_00005972 [Brassica cretica]